MAALILATWAFVSVGCVHGIEAPEEEWDRVFTNTPLSSVQQTTDGGYILVGRRSLVKTDPSGIKQWNQTYNAGAVVSVQQTTDGGYIMAGETRMILEPGQGYISAPIDAWLAKTDSNGNEQWNQSFGSTCADEAHTVQQTTDGGYILTGYTQYTIDHVAMKVTQAAWLVKTDSKGNEQWTRTFGGTTSSDEALSVQQTTDGGYILIGYALPHSYIGCDCWLMKTDSNGNEQWTRTFKSTTTSGNIAQSVQQTTDGGYILAGYTESYLGKDAWLVKTDSKGTKQWDRIFGGTSSDEVKSVQQTTDGGYIMAGYTSSYGAGEEDAWLVKTDSNGNELWNLTFGGSSSDKAYAVQQTSDDGYIIVGYERDLENGWLIKLAGQPTPITPTTSETPTQPTKPMPEEPGFEAVFAIAGTLGAALLMLKGRRDA